MLPSFPLGKDLGAFQRYLKTWTTDVKPTITKTERVRIYFLMGFIVDVFVLTGSWHNYKCPVLTCPVYRWSNVWRYHYSTWHLYLLQSVQGWMSADCELATRLHINWEQIPARGEKWMTTSYWRPVSGGAALPPSLPPPHSSMTEAKTDSPSKHRQWWLCNIYT